MQYLHTIVHIIAHLPCLLGMRAQTNLVVLRDDHAGILGKVQVQRRLSPGTSPSQDKEPLPHHEKGIHVIACLWMPSSCNMCNAQPLECACHLSTWSVPK